MREHFLNCWRSYLLIGFLGMFPAAAVLSDRQPNTSMAGEGTKAPNNKARVDCCVQMGDVYYVGLEFPYENGGFNGPQECYSTRGFEPGELIPLEHVSAYSFKGLRGKKYYRIIRNDAKEIEQSSVIKPRKDGS